MLFVEEHELRPHVFVNTFLIFSFHSAAWTAASAYFSAFVSPWQAPGEFVRM